MQCNVGRQSGLSVANASVRLVSSRERAESEQRAREQQHTNGRLCAQTRVNTQHQRKGARRGTQGTHTLTHTKAGDCREGEQSACIAGLDSASWHSTNSTKKNEFAHTLKFRTSARSGRAAGSRRPVCAMGEWPRTEGGRCAWAKAINGRSLATVGNQQRNAAKCCSWLLAISWFAGDLFADLSVAADLSRLLAIFRVCRAVKSRH